LILLLDHHDSFVYNLVQCFGSLDEVVVQQMSTLDADSVLHMPWRLLVLGPGPGHPSQLQKVLELVRRIPGHRHVFGVCLGLQLVVTALGGKVSHAPETVHGKCSAILHDGQGVFHGLPQGFQATRYHSLAADLQSLPAGLQVSAQTADGLVMGIRSRSHAVEAVQFHPDSFACSCGPALMEAAWRNTFGSPCKSL
jgi:anthranilate synthase/aminodeoxychorismate synthase-like glutamine amidotransferase